MALESTLWFYILSKTVSHSTSDTDGHLTLRMWNQLYWKLLTGCGKKSTTSSSGGKPETVISGIVAPGNLQSCPERFFEKKAEGGGMVVNCDQEQKGQFCSYYTTTKDGVTKIHNLEFKTECILCRTHQQKGETFLDSTSGKYIHLGYEAGACYQGMYKKTN